MNASSLISFVNKYRCRFTAPVSSPACHTQARLGLCRRLWAAFHAACNTYAQKTTATCSTSVVLRLLQVADLVLVTFQVAQAARGDVQFPAEEDPGSSRNGEASQSDAIRGSSRSYCLQVSSFALCLQLQPCLCLSKQHISHC